MAENAIPVIHAGQGSTTLTPAGNVPHRVARVAAGISSAAHDLGVDLTANYAQSVAAQGINECGQLGVTKLGNGVIIHTAPQDRHEHPIVIGYAATSSEWLRYGNSDAPDQGAR